MDRNELGLKQQKQEEVIGDKHFERVIEVPKTEAAKDIPNFYR